MTSLDADLILDLSWTLFVYAKDGILSHDHIRMSKSYVRGTFFVVAHTQ